MMRDLFPGYFRPTMAEFKRLWDEGLVAVDANILLHVYRYSPLLRDTLFALMEKLENRLWVPNRVAYEFSKNRLKVIASQEKAYDDACTVLEKLAGIIKSELPARHSVIEIEDIKEEFLALISRKQNALKQQKENHPSVPDDDPILARLSKLLEGKIGGPDSPDREQKITEEGERRIKAKIPPGFRDAGKDDDPLHRLGDFIVWRQLLDQVQSTKSAYLIFATDDSSDDWWWKQDGKTIGPHPALIHEAQREAKCRAYLYRGDQFIKYGSEHFGLKADQKLIDEAATVRRELLSHRVGVRTIPSIKILEVLTSFNLIKDPKILSRLSFLIYRTQYTHEGRELLDNELGSYGLPASQVILDKATQLQTLQRGRSLDRKHSARHLASVEQMGAKPPAAADPVRKAGLDVLRRRRS